MDGTDEKIEMTITINRLVAPLLYDALAGCRSPRQRAMRLRALAESALREPAQRGSHDVSPPQTVRTAIVAPRAELDASPQTDIQILRVAEVEAGAHDPATDSLADELSGYF